MCCSTVPVYIYNIHIETMISSCVEIHVGTEWSNRNAPPTPPPIYSVCLPSVSAKESSSSSVLYGCGKVISSPNTALKLLNLCLSHTRIRWARDTLFIFVKLYVYYQRTTDTIYVQCTYVQTKYTPTHAYYRQIQIHFIEEK